MANTFEPTAGNVEFAEPVFVSNMRHIQELKAAEKSVAQAVHSLDNGLSAGAIPVERGAAWTTDAPFRETQAAIDAARALGLHAVEMEAAALYAFAQARQKAVVCFAHVTNQMAQFEGDFEKGVANGSREALALVADVGAAWNASKTESS